MVKLVSLRSFTLVLAIHVTRTRARVVVGAATVQLKLPVPAASFVTAPLMTDQVEPLSRLISICTTALVPRLWLQRIACVLPTVQLTAVFGVVTVTKGTAIVKLASLRSLTAVFASHVTRKRAELVFDPETVQSKK